jgi:type IV pilus assembly protein PilB
MELWTEDQIAKTLLQKKVINEDQYQVAFAIQRESGKKFTRILCEKNIAPALKINTSLAGSGCSDLDSYIPDEDLIKKFREDLVRKHNVMPLFLLETKVYVSMSDSQNIEAQQMIGFSTGMNQLRIVPGSKEDITKLIDKYFGRHGAIEEAMKEVNSRKPSDSSEDRRFTPILSGQGDAPVVKLVDEYIQKALFENASDIHFEPQEDGLRIRFRIDGLLLSIETIPSSLIGPVTSRIKILSQLKIDQRMIPQDGRFSKSVDGTEIDFRVSSFPGIYGESLVLRILKRKMRIAIKELGLSPAVLSDFRKALKHDKGIFLVTGPTGCGKTTTLVSILHEIKDPTKKVVTLENPVEYQIDGVIQGQIHPQAGFTFSKGLRAIMRHDPNIIMVAEIRDPETASIAIEAGLTGHFVLSTLHTNNAPSTIIRLLEMGVEPYILSSSLIGILAQRLVRVICPECREPYTPSRELLLSIGLSEVPKHLKLYRGMGCKSCRNTGFKGRIGIFELMLITDKMRQMILRQSNSAEIEIEALKSGMRTLREDGIRQSLEGVTTLEEIMSVTQEVSAE